MDLGKVVETVCARKPLLITLLVLSSIVALWNIAMAARLDGHKDKATEIDDAWASSTAAAVIFSLTAIVVASLLGYCLMKRQA